MGMGNMQILREESMKDIGKKISSMVKEQRDISEIQSMRDNIIKDINREQAYQCQKTRVNIKEISNRINQKEKENTDGVMGEYILDNGRKVE